VFICFEGLDGAGKTTQARMLAQRLNNEGRPTTLVADPGTTRLGQSIRGLLLESDQPITPAAQMLLFSAARAELAIQIKELLAQNHVVICDRWILSTLVYQGEINKISTDLIARIFRETSYLCPDVTFLLDIDPVIVKRRRPDTIKLDRYERRSLDEYRRMRDAYKTHARYRPHARIVHHIDAAQGTECVHKIVYDLCSRVSSLFTSFV
jgi:dTMP kinase